VNRSFTTSVVTGALEYLVKSISCPTHRPIMMLKSVSDLLSSSAWRSGLQAVSKVSGFLILYSEGIPSSVLSRPPQQQTTELISSP